MKKQSFAKVCPNCIVELKPQMKKIGKESRWFVCHCCGYREKPLSEVSEMKIAGEFIGRLKISNSQQGIYPD